MVGFDSSRLSTDHKQNWHRFHIIQRSTLFQAVCSFMLHSHWLLAIHSFSLVSHCDHFLFFCATLNQIVTLLQILTYWSADWMLLVVSTTLQEFNCFKVYRNLFLTLTLQSPISSMMKTRAMTCIMDKPLPIMTTGAYVDCLMEMVWK